ncbi:MAG: DUF4838 domain-containing protein [Clostridia bacterium]|nr:DUF4838 domain-containing protein [Clostridia bacterium]
MKKIKYLLLAGVLAITTAFAACKSDEESSETENNTVSATNKMYDGGLHEIKYSETGKSLVKDGQCDYKILISANASDTIKLAAEELQFFFEEATSVKLPIVYDNTVTLLTPETKVINLGKTSISDDAGVKIIDEMGKYGYTIQTVGNSIFIDGKSDYASLWGVYGLLEIEFNYDCFTDRMYYVDEVENVSLKNYDVIDVPDMQIRTISSSFVSGKARNRMRFMDETDTVMGPSGSHTFFKYVSPETYNNPETESTYHPKWFSTDGKQLCLLAQGDDEERELMLNVVMEQMIEYIKAATNEGQFFSFSMEDTNTWCSCPACAATQEKYNGASAATLVMFNNDLASKLKAWMETEEGQSYAREFMISYIAYNRTLPAPVDYNAEKDEYIPVDENVVCHENTAIVFAPADMDFQHSIYEKCNESMYNAFRGWQACSSNFCIYDYGINYSYYNVMYDTFGGMQDFYQLAAEGGAYRYFTLMSGTKTPGGASGWSALKTYLISKLCWNVNEDMNALIDKFFSYYYGAAADEMHSVLQDTRLLSRKNMDTLCRYQSFYGALAEPKLWPKDFLQKCLDRIDKAIVDISYIKKIDPENYDVLYKNIVCERVQYEYLLIACHERSFANDYIYRLKLQTRADCELNEIVSFSEYPDLLASELWSSWGIA